MKVDTLESLREERDEAEARNERYRLKLATARPALHWTDTKPAQAGWHWLRTRFLNDKGFEMGSVIVLFDVGSIRIPSGNTFMSYAVNSIHGQWAGPINPPDAS